MSTKRLAALLTCHNRIEQTLVCLTALFQNDLPRGHILEVFLVDDGSSDGTGEVVKRTFPQVHVIYGDGGLYWNRGMRLAFDNAREQDFDYYLWLNDDVMLFSNTLRVLLETASLVLVRYTKPAIIVGTMQAGHGKVATYGGLTRTSRWHPFKYRLVAVSEDPVACDTMNGNCVLIPCEVVKSIGNLDVAFIHSIGDIDYGLRAKRAGFGVFVMPGYAGRCDRNPVADTLPDTLRERYKRLLGEKGLPLNAWCVFTRRHAGAMWMIFWLLPSVKIALSVIKRPKMHL